MDIDSDSLSTMFISLLESTGLAQRVSKPPHCFNNTLECVLTYGIEIEYLIILPHNSLPSDHCKNNF